MQPDSNCKMCTALIRLCSGLDYFPADPEVRLLLIERLHRLAKDHTHAKAMIDRWLENETIAPKVADLVGLAANVGTSSAPGLHNGCELCNGEPFVVNEHGASRCTCKRGRALLQMEQNYAIAGLAIASHQAKETTI